jgi:hypothetical protein
LHITGTKDDKILEGVENPEPKTTNIVHGRTDFEITFTGRYDERNSSQRLVINTTAEAVITFSAGTQWQPPIWLLPGVLATLSVCFIL